MTQPPVLVISCDRYADVWDPFFALFRLRWPDCPFPLFLGTNQKRYENTEVTTLAIGDDESWASGVLKMLDALEGDHVIVFLEDFMLQQRVDTAAVLALVDLARRERVGCLRLVAHMPLAYAPTRPVAGVPGVGEIERGALHRVSLQVAIWRVETLRRLLVPGETAWDFEVLGTALSNRLPEPFWGVYESVIRYDQAVEKGKWKPAGLRICQEAGVPVDLTARGTFTEEELQSHFDRYAAESEAEDRKRRMLHLFRGGRRLRGLAAAASAIRLRPVSLQLWAAALAGTLGPRCFAWAEGKYLDRRVAAVRRRVAGERA